MIDEVLWTLKLDVTSLEYIAEDISRPDLVNIIPDRRKDLLDVFIGDKPLPVFVVLIDVVLEPVALDCSVIPPGIATEQFIASCAAQDDLDELARQLRGVVIRVALSDSRLLEVISQPGHGTFHVTGFEDHFIMLGLVDRRHGFSLDPLIERHLDSRRGTEIKSTSKGLDVWQLLGSQRRQSSRVHTPREIGTKLDITDQLS